MVFLQLFLTFFKIGLFGFGGGYAMLSMIQGEVVTKYHWLTSYEFTDIVAMSQMTPGPIGINSATYVGYTAIVNAGYSHAVGILGSMTSTFAVVLPSFILMILISRFFLKYQKHPVIASVFSGLRPGVVGLLAAASLVLMNEENFGTETRQIVISCIIFIGAFIASYKFKVSPILLICICGVIGLLTSCNGTAKSEKNELEGDTLQMNWSELLCMIEYDGYTKAVIKNPWKEGETLNTYIISEPLSHSIVYSSVHCGVLDELGARETIAGVCDLEYIFLDWVHEANNKGTIADCGNSMNPDIEKIIDISPDAILLSPYENSGGYGRLEKLGIPIIECADYMETSPLGRAEWIRFFGRLFGKADVADSIFAQVEKDYLSLKETASAEDEKPLLFAEMKTGAAWYVAGGRSTMGQLYQDAGADYVFSYLNESGSVPLSFETVFEKAHDADIWLIKYAQPSDMTYSEMLSSYEPYKGFRAFKEHNVYGCNTSKALYYEETPFHPELLLKDVINVVHPSLLKDCGSRYFKRLEE